MMKISGFLGAALALAVPLWSGCATAPATSPASTAEMSKSVLELRIEPGKVAEKCIKLDTGQRLSWRFESSAAVDFNLHTHRGRDVVTPVEHRGMTSHSGDHAVDAVGDYCMMWENRGGVPAFVKGEWRVAAR